MGPSHSVREQSTIHPPAEILVPGYVGTVEAEILSLPLVAYHAVDVVSGLACITQVTDAFATLDFVRGSRPLAATTLLLILGHITLFQRLDL
jgi:hypothetical protein